MMRRWLQTLAGVFVLTGCWTSSGSVGTNGSTNSAAAQALTKALSFVGGTLESGAVPNADATDVSLLPGSEQTVQPGDTALLGFDVDNPNEASDPASFALIQFEDQTQHFQVKMDDTTSAQDASTLVPDTGVGTPVPIVDSGSATDQPDAFTAAGDASVDSGTSLGIDAG
ncbi:MAG TPA: hypothetical protein VF331_22865, partial [Polyangiales bacterium]